MIINTVGIITSIVALTVIFILKSGLTRDSFAFEAIIIILIIM